MNKRIFYYKTIEQVEMVGDLLFKKYVKRDNIIKRVIQTILVLIAFTGLVSCNCCDTNTPTAPATSKDIPPNREPIDKISPTITNHSFIIPENVPFNYEVGQIFASDNVMVTAFIISNGNVGVAFAINKQWTINDIRRYKLREHK